MVQAGRGPEGAWPMGVWPRVGVSKRGVVQKGHGRAALRGWDSPSAQVRIFQFSSVTQSCPALCDPMNCSTPGLPVRL